MSEQAWSPSHEAEWVRRKPRRIFSRSESDHSEISHILNEIILSANSQFAHTNISHGLVFAVNDIDDV